MEDFQNGGRLPIPEEKNMRLVHLLSMTADLSLLKEMYAELKDSDFPRFRTFIIAGLLIDDSVRGDEDIIRNLEATYTLNQDPSYFSAWAYPDITPLLLIETGGQKGLDFIKSHPGTDEENRAATWFNGGVTEILELHEFSPPDLPGDVSLTGDERVIIKKIFTHYLYGLRAIWRNVDDTSLYGENLRGVWEKKKKRWVFRHSEEKIPFSIRYEMQFVDDDSRAFVMMTLTGKKDYLKILYRFKKDDVSWDFAGMWFTERKYRDRPVDVNPTL
jgi:hypothetical protein